MIMEFDYTNYEGKKSHRKVMVKATTFKATKWHPEPQWIITGFDQAKNEERDFAARDMTNVVIPYSFNAPIVSNQQ